MLIDFEKGNEMINIARKIVMSVFVLFLLGGCASELTDKTIMVAGSAVTPIVKELEISVILRDVPSAVNKYYFIFSPTENIQILSADYQIDSFFLVPGMPYTDEQQLRDAYYAGAPEKTIQDIYDDFFSSWMELITYDGAFFSLKNGSFVSGNEQQHLEYTGQHIDVQESIVGNTLTFTINLDLLTYTDKIYFQILTVDENNLLKDYTDNGCFIDVVDNQTKNEADDSIGSILGSLDILSWQARIDIY